MITSGVRQLPKPEAGRNSSAVAAMRIPDAGYRSRRGRSGTLQGVNAFACKSQSAASRKVGSQCSDANWRGQPWARPFCFLHSGLARAYRMFNYTAGNDATLGQDVV